MNVFEKYEKDFEDACINLIDVMNDIIFDLSFEAKIELSKYNLNNPLSKEEMKDEELVEENLYEVIDVVDIVNLYLPEDLIIEYVKKSFQDKESPECLEAIE